MNLLIDIAAFIMAIAILVTVHEFGHFWVAKKLGVKVLRFSVGFGRPLWKRVAGSDQTEYVIAAIPLGGYVKMLDEREGEVAPEDRTRAFNRKPVASRMAIVAAGPVFNFLFAIVAYWLMFIAGVDGIRPYVGEVAVNTPAAYAGFQQEELITHVGEVPTTTWEQVRMELLDRALDAELVELSTVDASGQQHQRQLNLTGYEILKQEGDFLKVIGIAPWRPVTPMIAETLPGGAAARDGLKARDLIITMDGRKIDDVVGYIQARAGRTIAIEVEREGERMIVNVTPDEKELDGRTVGFINAQIGGYATKEVMEQLSVVVSYGPVEALPHALAKTWSSIALTLRVLGKLVVGDASLKNISGPITIADVAGDAALLGVSTFLYMLGIISISLGVLNLLPVPILDGGHLLYYFIELLKGSPVSEEVEAIGQRIGIAMLAALMVLAFYNDITRLFN